MQGEILTLKPQEADFTYEVSYNETDLNIEKIKSIAMFLADIDDKNLKNKEFVDTYTSLPDNFSKAVVNYAKKITEGSKSDYQSIALLVQHLTDVETFSYTNSKKLRKVPDGTDITVELLRSKRGNSVYYATALATMSRSLGIPSRLVAGYRISGEESLLSTTNWNKELKCFEVSEDDAFCWTECYISGLGWVAFYPSPVSVAEVSSQSRPPSNVLDSILNGEGPPEQEFIEDELPEENNDDKQNNPFKIFMNIPIMVATILVLIILLLLLRCLIAPIFTNISTVRFWFKNRTTQARFYLYDIRNLLFVLKINTNSADTTHTISEKLKDFECCEEVSDALRIIDRAQFSLDALPTNEEIELIAAADKLLQAEVKRKSTNWHYLVFGRLFRGDKITFLLSSLIIKSKIKLHK